jgi:hypothetical protein
MTEITAKVADILTLSQVVLNVGTTSGVKKDDEGFIYEIREILDPDTKESLGSLRIRKLDLRVTVVQSRICVATVTSYVDTVARPTSAATVRRRRTITTDPEEERKGEIVYVGIGEPVIIRQQDETRSEKDEPPF